MKSQFLVCITLAIMTTHATSPAAASHARAAHEHAFDVTRPLAEAFTFFEPIGEKRWAEDWQPVFATPEDRALHNGSVFTVDRPNPHGGAPISSVWVITRYDPPHVIEYQNVLVGLRATRITVRCLAAGPERTRVTVRYVYTGLSEAGDAAIRKTTAESFTEMIDSWGTMIATYLERGTPASP